MTQTQPRSKVRMTRGKFDGINAVADERGVIAAMAIDQRLAQKGDRQGQGRRRQRRGAERVQGDRQRAADAPRQCDFAGPGIWLEAVKHRATWQDGIPEYGKGERALRAWLSGRGVQNIEALNEVLSKGAKPWWDFYGGKDNVEVVDLPAV
jgi:hypothetical protein